MVSKAEKLLERMRNRKQNWKRKDVDSLLKGYDFIIDTARGGHDKAHHPDHPELFTMLPRHTKVAPYIIDQIVKLIDKLKLIEEEDDENHE
jgi:hypothetical protein